jgi:hypothetical protein
LAQGRRYEIGRKGRITGDDRYTYVLVQEDPQSKGYFILLWVDEGDRNTYDDWVPDESYVDNYFEFEGWTIEWL